MRLALASVLRMSGRCTSCLFLLLAFIPRPVGVEMDVRTSCRALEVRGELKAGMEMGVMRICISCHFPSEVERESPRWGEQTMADLTPLRSSAEERDSLVWRDRSRSALCLSCHDGTIGPPVSGSQLEDRSGVEGAHPVGVRYSRISEPYRQTSAWVDHRSSRGPRLVGPERLVGCISCHDPHGKEENFLRLALNDRGDICLDCHNK
jgi:predicted CXXCH cytochrome family protein